MSDELKPLVFSIADLAYVDEIRVTKNFQNPHDHAVYKAAEVDAAIAELKAENRRLKRALWLARAYRGYDNSILLPSKFMRKVWDYVERKCRAKAEEYK